MQTSNACSYFFKYVFDYVFVEKVSLCGKTYNFCIFSDTWPLAPNIAKEGSGLLKTYVQAGWHWPPRENFGFPDPQKVETLIFVILGLN